MIVNEQTYTVEAGRPGFRRALLFNPPVYDAQYWARWSQPAGLLRLATLLKSKGFNVNLIDCMETNAKGMVPKTHRRTAEGGLMVVERGDIEKTMWHFGLKWTEVERKLCKLRDDGQEPLRIPLKECIDSGGKSAPIPFECAHRFRSKTRRVSPWHETDI